jgi:hypothetical protein
MKCNQAKRKRKKIWPRTQTTEGKKRRRER